MNPAERETWVAESVNELVKRGYNRTEGLRLHAEWLADKYPKLTPAQAVSESEGEAE